jgi:hypothetical protein
MTEFTVTWSIDVEADTPEDAAREAQAIQRDPDSSATIFRVTPTNDPEGGENIDVVRERGDSPDADRLKRLEREFAEVMAEPIPRELHGRGVELAYEIVALRKRVHGTPDEVT